MAEALKEWLGAEPVVEGLGGSPLICSQRCGKQTTALYLDPSIDQMGEELAAPLLDVFHVGCKAGG